MSDFVFNGYDYSPHIKTDEDLRLFNRLREIEPHLAKPVKECIEYVIEAANIDRKLRRMMLIKFYFVDTSKSNLN